jgi:hypothetical protein
MSSPTTRGTLRDVSATDLGIRADRQAPKAIQGSHRRDRWTAGRALPFLLKYSGHLRDRQKETRIQRVAGARCIFEIVAVGFLVDGVTATAHYFT